MSDPKKDSKAKPADEKVVPEGKVADAELGEVDGGVSDATFPYDRSKPRKGTHLYDGTDS